MLAKVAEINRNSKVLQPGTFCDAALLTIEDYTEFVSWLLSTTTLPRKAEINAKLLELRKLRSTCWHVNQAPDSILLPEKSM